MDEVKRRALAVVQHTLAHLGVPPISVDETFAVRDLGTRLLLVERLEEVLGRRCDDLAVLGAQTVGDLLALAAPPTGPEAPAASRDDEDAATSDEP